MNYILGLDVGLASVTWTAVALDARRYVPNSGRVRTFFLREWRSGSIFESVVDERDEIGEIEGAEVLKAPFRCQGAGDENTASWTWRDEARGKRKNVARSGDDDVEEKYVIMSEPYYEKIIKIYFLFLMQFVFFPIHIRNSNSYLL